MPVLAAVMAAADTVMSPPTAVLFTPLLAVIPLPARVVMGAVAVILV